MKCEYQNRSFELRDADRERRTGRQGRVEEVNGNENSGKGGCSFAGKEAGETARGNLIRSVLINMSLFVKYIILSQSFFNDGQF